MEVETNSFYFNEFFIDSVESFLKINVMKYR